jgi:Uma2 family endonuclease
MSAAPPIVVRNDVTADMYFGMGPSTQPQNLIDGLLYLSPSPSDDHEDIVVAIIHALRTHAREHGGHVLKPRFDCWLDSLNVVQPDTGYLAPERVSLAGRYIHGAPDLVVEVLSRGTRAFDNEAKFALYGKSGAREAWFVDPDTETVTVVNGNGQAWEQEYSVQFGERIPSQLVDVGDGNLKSSGTS